MNYSKLNAHALKSDAVGYAAYRGLRILPSLAPPLWWTIPANIVTP